MKTKLFHFIIDKENFFAFFCGIVMILLSMAMTLFHSEFMNIVLRDVCMILLLGFFLPLYYLVIVKRKSLSVLGLHKDKLIVSLSINVIAAASLLAMFISQNTETFLFSADSFYAITYIFAAGIFEMIFIYGFLRYEFEQAFGIIPSAFLTAVFYSLHHAGFQPEFTKLFFVGLMYVTVFYFTRSLFAIFPFFWGVGAVWDVLVNSEAGSEIKNEKSFIIAVFLFLAMVGIGSYIFRTSKRRALLSDAPTKS